MLSTPWQVQHYCTFCTKSVNFPIKAILSAFQFFPPPTIPSVNGHFIIFVGFVYSSDNRAMLSGIICPWQGLRNQAGPVWWARLSAIQKFSTMDTDDYILPVTIDGVCQGPTLESGLEEGLIDECLVAGPTQISRTGKTSCRWPSTLRMGHRGLVQCGSSNLLKRSSW